MEDVLTSLRRLSAGLGAEHSVFRAAAALPSSLAAAAAPSASFGSEGEEVGDASSDNGGVVDFDLRVHESEGGRVESDSEDGDVADDDVDQAGATGEELVTELYSWGRSNNYQLGFGVHSGEQLVPRVIALPPKVQVSSVACGRFHTILITKCGGVYTWGFGGSTGRLGIDPTQTGGSAGAPSFLVEPTPLPEFGPGRHRASKAAAGLGHSLVVTAAGKILAWGCNSHGQLGTNQGVTGTGDAAHARRSVMLKGGLPKGDAVTDIAAGAEHSLCVAGEAGNVFVWGSNEHGALGLGAPPEGPPKVGTPQQLPHQRGAYGVVASAMQHVSVVLGAHGDAVVFGRATRNAEGRAGKASDAIAVDPKQFIPARIRRRERKLTEEDDWQMQRSSVAAGGQITSVAISSEEAFAVDSDGVLWSWPLNSARPCCADRVLLAPAVASSPMLSSKAAIANPKPLEPPATVAAVAVADRLQCVWIVDGTAGRNLWRLQRGGQRWNVERFEQLSQVSCLTCGPEHQTVAISYKRPALPPALPPAPPASPPCFMPCPDPYEFSFPREDIYVTPAVEVKPAPSMVRTLQQICEDRLCNIVSPRSLGLLCEVAWELNRPAVLDHAYAFLKANALLMCSRTYLPVLAQMPLEVLAAFELAAQGKLSAPSEALSFLPSEFPPQELLEEAPDLHPALEPSAAETPAGDDHQTSGQRRRRKGGSGNAGSPKTSFDPVPNKHSPHLSPSPPSSPVASPTSGPIPAQRIPGLPPPASPLLQAAGSSGAKGDLDPAGWIPVSIRSRRAKPGAGTNGVNVMAKTGPATNGSCMTTATKQSKPSPPQSAAPKASEPAVSGSPPLGPSRPLPTFGDFIRRKSSTSTAASAPEDGSSDQGPSALLAAALKSAQAAGWGTSDRSAAPEAPSMRKILEETGSNQAAPRTRTGRANEDSSKPSHDPTHCSWGFDAMPSEKPKGKCLYVLQEEEKADQARKKEAEELKEIEAMFAALAVAELAEEREKLGIKEESDGEKSAQQGSKAKNKAKAKKSAGASSADSSAGSGRGGRRAGGGKGPGRNRGDWTEGHSQWQSRGGGWKHSSQWWYSSSSSWWNEGSWTECKWSAEDRNDAEGEASSSSAAHPEVTDGN